jgi:hypothetical protein
MPKKPIINDKEEQLRINLIVAKADAFDAFLNYDQSTAKWREALDRVRVLGTQYQNERESRGITPEAPDGVSGQPTQENPPEN